MPVKIAFTGPAKYCGYAVNREDINDAAVKAGFIVRDKVDSQVDMLVASRTDTVKAINAAKTGIDVVTYQQFGDILHSLGVVIVASGKPVNPYTDVDVDSLIPDFTVGSTNYGDLL